MSSDFHDKNTSRNLVRVSGPGYRENIDLRQSGKDAPLAGGFRARVTDAGLTFWSADMSELMQSTGMRSLRSERRDTARPEF